MFYLYVACGGAIGAICRALIVNQFTSQTHHFPFAVMGVNIFGSLVIGLIAGFLHHRAEDVSQFMFLRGFVILGLLGGFTTFSAFSNDVVQLFLKEAFFDAGVYIIMSVMLSILAASLGYYVMAK